MASSVAGLTLKEFFAQKAVPKIVAICGSQRIGSFNKIVRDYAVTRLNDNGAKVTSIDLESLQLPLYNPNDDSKANFPETAKSFKAQLVESDGIFIASPEYNGFTSPLLLNAITWATRGEGDMYDGFKGKVATVMATSPGPMGGLRMIRSLNQMLQDMGAVVVPGNNSIGSAYKVFDIKNAGATGAIVDERSRQKIDTACDNLLTFCRYQANREQDCAVAKEILSNMGEYGKVDL